MRAMDFLHAPEALVAMLAAFAVSLACLGFLLSPVARRLILDQPNERSLHERPVSRSGGIAIAAGVAAAAFAAPHGLAAPLALSGALAALSLADDVLTLPTLLRLTVHFAAAGTVLGLEIGVADPALFVLLLLAIAWYTNLYNFMDGSDGLAGGMTVFGFGAYAWAAHQSGNAALTMVSASIAAASGAFLLVNFHPARLFMGDAGAIPLGFLAGALGLAGWRDGLWPAWFPLLVFSPFVVDASLTLARRIARGDKVWIAHREHYYQRLVRMGFGHLRTALAEYALMAACAAAALAARAAPGDVQAAALAASVAGYCVLAVWIDTRWSRHKAGSAPG